MHLFKTDRCREFLAHWQSLRVGDALPTLHDFLGRPNTALQPHVAIKDLIDPTFIRVRLYGTALVDLSGLDLTGLNLLDFATQAQMARELWAYQSAVAEGPVGLATVKRAVTASGRSIAFEDVELPLLPFPGGAPCVICCVGFMEVIDYRDTMFKLVAHTTARWVDLGWGVPEAEYLQGARSRV